jgi:hypothetical protein
MSTISLGAQSVVFAVLPPGTPATPQSVSIVVNGDQPIVVSLSLTGPNASAFAVELMYQYLTASIAGHSGGMNTTLQGQSSSIAPVTASSPKPGAGIQVSFVAPSAPLPGIFTAAMLVSWPGGSITVPLSGSTAQLTASIGNQQPIVLNAGAKNIADVAITYLSLDPTPLTVQLTQTSQPTTNQPLPPTADGLQISPATLTMVPALVGSVLNPTRTQTAALAISTEAPLAAGTSYGYINVSLPALTVTAPISPGASLKIDFKITPIYAKWLSLAAQTNAQGTSVQSYLGYSTGGQSAISATQGGGTVQYFQRGMIVARADGTVWVVYGAIYVRYQDLNGLGSVLGQPIQDEAPAAGGGRVSHFEKGDIYWDSDHGAHEIHGAIRDRYNALGGPGGVLGYPVTNETAVTQKGNQAGSFNRFVNDGVIYWSQSAGAWEIYGVIRDAWENQYKGVNGPLGFPVAAQGTIAAVTAPVALPKAIHGSFQTGALVWLESGSKAGINLVTGLDVYVERFDARGTRGVGETVGLSGTNLYVKVNISSTTAPALADIMPASGDYGGGKAVQQHIYPVPVVRGDLILSVSFAGFDRVKLGSDDALGTVTASYNAQNLWGIGQLPDPNAWQNDFLATYDIYPHNTYDAAQFRQEMSWGFDNVGTPNLTWDQYAQTFSDVSISENNAGGYILHPFDHLFYTVVYSGLSANGNCFGLCVGSIYAQVGRSLFAEPIITYPWEAAEINEVNVKMGYQLGGDLIDWFLGQVIIGNTHDPVNVFKTSLDQYQRGDYPVITLTTNSMFGDGHCVRPFKWHDGDYPGHPGAMVIEVSNPDAPAINYTDSGGNQHPAVLDGTPCCLIVIDQTANTFTLTKSALSDPTIYAGGEWSGGRMLSIPFCQFSCQPRTPFWEVLGLLVAGTLIILGGDAQTQQVTDGTGKTFYESDLATLPTKWEDIRQDASQRIANMARIPFHSDTAAATQPNVPGDLQIATLNATLTALGHLVILPSKPEFYYLHGNGGTLKHEFTGLKAGTSQWHMRVAGLAAVLTLTTEAGKTDAMQVNNVGSAIGSVTVTTAASGSPRQAVFSVNAGSQDGVPLFTVNNFTLAPAQPITFGLSDDGQSFVMQNAGIATTFDLTVQMGSAAAQIHKGVSLDAGKTGVFSLVAASSASATAFIHQQMLDRPGGTLLSEMNLD